MALGQHDDHDDGNCDEAIASLYTYLDHELSADDMVRVRTHLEDCSPCFEAFDFEAELRIVVAKKCTESMPPGLLDRLLSICKGEEPAVAEHPSDDANAAT